MGWIPPEDRSWRHPSEIPTAAATPRAGGRHGGATVPAPVTDGPDRRPRMVATMAVGFGAAAAVIAGVLLLMNAGTGTVPMQSAVAGGSPTVASAMSGCCKVVPTAAQPVQQSMVALEVSTGNGTTQSCGVVVAQGGLVATTADAVAGARSVTAITDSGDRVTAVVVATDRDSDVALLRVFDDLPVARFADDTTINAGRPAMVMAVAARSGKGRSDTTLWSQDTVESVGTAVQGGDATGMAAVTTEATAVPAMPGSALLEPSGQVLGILDSSGRPASGDGEETFLPTQLVVGVAKDLAETGQVLHGWLDVSGRDAPEGSTHVTVPTTGASITSSATSTQKSAGALVTSVEADGASTHLLQVGDVIVSLNGAPVRSMAELRSRLYVLGPGTTVQLGVARGGELLTVDVSLSSSP